MIYFLAVVIALPLLTYVVFPQLDPAFRNSTTAPKPVDPEQQSLEAEKDRYYEAIQDLDSEYECGKLSQEDHETMRRRLVNEVSAVLKRLDEMEENESQ